MKKVAALFVASDGPYSTMPGVDAWDIERDARLYPGPHPVVAHPPCQLWGKFAKINYLRWGGQHNKPGNDGGCFLSALQSVRTYGGVIEHPGSSYAWSAYGLSKPRPNVGWIQISNSEWVCEVFQSMYGHLATKRTWLFYCGRNKPIQLIWGKKIGTHQIGFYDQRGKDRNKPTISGKKASETPKLFAKILVDIARSA